MFALDINEMGEDELLSDSEEAGLRKEDNPMVEQNEVIE